MDRLQAVIQMNPEFAKAFVRGESWAMEYADQVKGLDSNGSRTHMDRVFDGEKQNWCGTCPYPSGCVMCDLDGSHNFLKEYGHEKFGRAVGKRLDD